MDKKDIFNWFILIIAIYLILKLLKNFTSIFGGGTGGGLGAGVYDLPTDDLEQDLKNLQNRGINPTISDSTASSYADAIQNENMSWDTSEENIYDIFTYLNNEADLILLKIKFGLRRPAFEASYVGLSAFLRADLSSSWIKDINDNLTSKGISKI